MKAGFKIGYVDTVHGECPHCGEDTLLVAIVTDYYNNIANNQSWQ